MSELPEAWLASLEERHLRELSFAEVRRALQALSALYVERRGRLAEGAALEGAGKRAAFALYYGPVHLLVVREVARALGAPPIEPPLLVDLGCGTGAAGAGWAVAVARPPEILGIERNGWAAGEAAWSYARLGLRGRARRADLDGFTPPRRFGALLAAFTVNELDEGRRERLLPRLIDASRGGAQVLVVEPLARGVTPWWDAWAGAFGADGGRADEWRFPLRLPQRLALLGRAAGLDHRELRARSLWLPGGPASRRAG